MRNRVAPTRQNAFRRFDAAFVVRVDGFGRFRVGFAFAAWTTFATAALAGRAFRFESFRLFGDFRFGFDRFRVERRRFGFVFEGTTTVATAATFPLRARFVVFVGVERVVANRGTLGFFGRTRFFNAFGFFFLRDFFRFFRLAARSESDAFVFRVGREERFEVVQVDVGFNVVRRFGDGGGARFFARRAVVATAERRFCRAIFVSFYRCFKVRF